MALKQNKKTTVKFEKNKPFESSFAIFSNKQLHDKLGCMPHIQLKLLKLSNQKSKWR